MIAEIPIPKELARDWFTYTQDAKLKNLKVRMLFEVRKEIKNHTRPVKSEAVRIEIRDYMVHNHPKIAHFLKKAV